MIIIMLLTSITCLIQLPYASCLKLLFPLLSTMLRDAPPGGSAQHHESSEEHSAEYSALSSEEHSAEYKYEESGSKVTHDKDEVLSRMTEIAETAVLREQCQENKAKIAELEQRVHEQQEQIRKLRQAVEARTQAIQFMRRTMYRLGRVVDGHYNDFRAFEIALP